MAERYEQVDGPPGSAIFNKWLTSGDFPNYDTNVTLTIAKVMLGHDLDVPGPNKKDEGIVAFFDPTRPGKPPKQLLLNKGHQKALTLMFGKVMVDWRGEINLFVTRQSVKVGGVLHDQVKIRERKPAVRSPIPLNAEPNKGGGVGKLGEPKVTLYTPDPNEKLRGETVTQGFLEEVSKKDSPAMEAFKTMGKEVKHTGIDWASGPDSSVKLPAEDPSLIPELCGKPYPRAEGFEAIPPSVEDCDMLPKHEGVCSWARDPATGDPLPEHLV